MYNNMGIWTQMAKPKESKFTYTLTTRCMHQGHWNCATHHVVNNFYMYLLKTQTTICRFPLVDKDSNEEDKLLLKYIHAEKAVRKF